MTILQILKDIEVGLRAQVVSDGPRAQVLEALLLMRKKIEAFKEVGLEPTKAQAKAYVDFAREKVDAYNQANNLTMPTNQELLAQLNQVPDPA